MNTIQFEIHHFKRKEKLTGQTYVNLPQIYFASSVRIWTKYNINYLLKLLQWSENLHIGRIVLKKIACWFFLKKLFTSWDQLVKEKM